IACGGREFEPVCVAPVFPEERFGAHESAAEQCRHDVFTVRFHSCWWRRASQGTERGKEVDGGDNAVGIDEACGNVAGPAGDEGDADAAFVEAQLTRAERAVAIAKDWQSAIVTKEEQEGVCRAN